MEPITFLLWMWLTWGTVRMFTGAKDEATAPAPGSPARTARAGRARAATPATTGGTKAEPAERPAGWAQRADAAARAARTTDWGNPGWWLRAALAAAWTPVADLRKGRRWYQDRKERRRQGEAEVDQPQADKPKADEPQSDRPEPEVNEPKADEPDTEQDRQDKPEADERQGEGPKVDDSETGRERRHGDECQDEESEPWWRPYQRQADDGGDYEVEVEVVRSRPPGEAPALERPQPSLTAGTTTGTGGGAGAGGGERPSQTPPGPSGPVVQVVDAVRVDELEEGTSDMSKYVAIPGASNAPKTSVETGGNTHDDAVHLAKQIVKAVKMTTDPATEAEAMIRASLRAAWAAVDQLAAAGISGQVVDKWANTVIAFDAAHKTAARLAVELNAAHEAAVDAERLQRRLGDRIQAAVEAAGKSAANSTRYYGKS